MTNLETRSSVPRRARRKTPFLRLLVGILLTVVSLSTVASPADARTTCGTTAIKTANYRTAVWGTIYQHRARSNVCEDDHSILSMTQSINEMNRKSFTARLYSSSTNWFTDSLSSTKKYSRAFGTFTATLGFGPAAVNFDFTHHFSFNFKLRHGSVTYTTRSSTWYN